MKNCGVSTNQKKTINLRKEKRNNNGKKIIKLIFIYHIINIWCPGWYSSHKNSRDNFGFATSFSLRPGNLKNLRKALLIFLYSIVTFITNGNISLQYLFQAMWLIVSILINTSWNLIHPSFRHECFKISAILRFYIPWLRQTNAQSTKSFIHTVKQVQTSQNSHKQKKTYKHDVVV